MARYTPAHNKASQKYQLKAYDRLAIVVPKGDKEKYKQFAESQGKSLNQWVRDLMEKEMGGK